MGIIYQYPLKHHRGPSIKGSPLQVVYMNGDGRPINGDTFHGVLADDSSKQPLA